MKNIKDRILSETPELVKQKVRETANKLVERKQETLEEVPTELDSVLAKITHQNDLGLSQWYEVVYYADDRWCSYSGSKTFQDGERVTEWKYCKDQFLKEK